MSDTSNHFFVILIPGILNNTIEKRTLMDNFTFISETVKCLLYDKYTVGIELNGTNMQNIKFNSSIDTVFLVHGWHSDPIVSNFESIKDAYLRTRPINVILVDWREIAKNEYLFSKLSVMRVAKEIAKIINKMTNLMNLNLEKVSFVGHSLGAHISAVCSRILGGKVQHITGKSY